MIRLIPRETKFFDLFAELSTHMNEGARLLRSILEDPHDLEARVDEMQAIEHRGDKATHAIMTKLNQTFITPFDREDIHHLASSLDDVLDFMNAAATRLVMYKIAQPTCGGGGAGGNPGAAKRRTGARRFAAGEKWQGDAALRRNQPAGG